MRKTVEATMLRTTALALLLSAATLGSFAANAQQFTRGNALVNQSAYAVDSERWGEAVNLANEALRSGEVTLDNLPALYNNLCIGLTGQRRFQDAITACDKALDMKPREWKFYNNRANVYFYLGQFGRALAEYYKAVTFNPANGILMSNINLTLEYRKSRAEKSS
jgi:tetratricopeptide (TPR) repeat protein